MTSLRGFFKPAATCLPLLLGSLVLQSLLPAFSFDDPFGLRKPTAKVLPATTLSVAVASPATGMDVKQPRLMRYQLSALLRCTRDSSILEAFYLLPGTSGEPMLDRIARRPVRVFFKDLSQIDKRVRNFDALSWLSGDGQQLVFINEKHRNAPPAALAAIISHEVLHDDVMNSMNEEIAGWTQEALVWSEMKARHPELSQIPPGQYPLVDRLNQIESAYHVGSLTQMVRTNPGYTGLPETSPGFSARSAQNVSVPKP
jgi:hypothetical protein